jgi:ABC-type lipoprotein release transport system permease subunit
MKSQKYRFTWILAKRDLLEEKRISLIVIAMLSFSFLNLAFFPAFVNGLSFLFTDNFVETQTGHVQIEAETGRLHNADALVRSVEGLDGVVDVEKRLTFQADLVHGSETRTAPVIGSSELDRRIYEGRLQSGQLWQPSAEDKIVLGQFVANDGSLDGADGLGVQEGRVITMRLDGREQEFTVTGVIGRPGPGGVVSQTFIPYSDAEELLGLEDAADSIKIVLEDRSLSESFKKRLERLNTRGEIQTWEEVSDISSAIDSTFGIVTGVVSLVGLIIAVTSIGVVIFINSSKRKREMGIIRSIGTESVQVLHIFLLEAIVFGALGTLIGASIMLGIHAYLGANPLQTPLGPLSTRLSETLILTRAAWMMAAAAVAGFVPAYVVANLSIIDSIEGR